MIDIHCFYLPLLNLAPEDDISEYPYWMNITLLLVF